MHEPSMHEPSLSSAWRPRGVLFDKDGTLLDFSATWMPVYRALAGDLSTARISAQALLETAGYDRSAGRCLSGSPLACGSAQDIALCWQQSLGERELGALVAKIERAFARAARECAIAVCDLPLLMRGLRERGYVLGIATMDSEALARAFLTEFGVVHEFSFVCGYDSGHGVKPGPGMVLAFCHACGLAPADVLVAGDTVHDMRMARAAGAGLVVGVLSGASDRGVLEPFSDVVLGDVSELEGLLESPAGAHSRSNS